MANGGPVTPDARSRVLGAAEAEAKLVLQFVVGGPVVGSQEGDDPDSVELILADGSMYRLSVDFEVM